MLRVYPALESLSQAAAGLLVRRAAECVQARGRFSVVLSGGATPRRIYELLAQPPLRDQVTWSRMHVFWGDERCVPPDDPRSNAGMAHEAWLEKVPIPPAQIHPMLCGPFKGLFSSEAVTSERYAVSFYTMMHSKRHF